MTVQIRLVVVVLDRMHAGTRSDTCNIGREGMFLARVLEMAQGTRAVSYRFRTANEYAGYTVVSLLLGMCCSSLSTVAKVERKRRG